MLAQRVHICAVGVLAGFILIFAAMAADAQGQYRIRAGDTLQIEVLEDSTLNRSALVLPDGTFSFPFVGSTRASGRSVDEVRRQLTAKLAPKFATEPTVVVSVAALAERRARTQSAPDPDPVIPVYIMGEVASPGKKEVAPGTTILQVLAEAGGLTPFAAGTRVQLHRLDPNADATHVYLFSYTGRARGPRISPATRLAPGDVVVVPARALFE